MTLLEDPQVLLVCRTARPPAPVRSPRAGQRLRVVVFNNLCASRTGATTASCPPGGVAARRRFSEMGGDSEDSPELGHVVPIVVHGLVSLVEVDLLLGEQAPSSSAGTPQARMSQHSDAPGLNSSSTSRSTASSGIQGNLIPGNLADQGPWGSKARTASMNGCGGR